MQREQYEVNWKNYYDILGLIPKADTQEIKRSYRRLARKYHPDLAEGSIRSYRMAEINEAYEVLSHADRRAKYDERFIFIPALTAEEDLDIELKEVMTRLVREQREYHRMKRSAVHIRAHTLVGSFFAWTECLQVPIPLFFASLIHLSMNCVMLLLLFSNAFLTMMTVPIKDTTS